MCCVFLLGIQILFLLHSLFVFTSGIPIGSCFIIGICKFCGAVGDFPNFVQYKDAGRDFVIEPASMDLVIGADRRGKDVLRSVSR